MVFSVGIRAGAVSLTRIGLQCS